MNVLRSGKKTATKRELKDDRSVVHKGTYVVLNGVETHLWAILLSVTETHHVTLIVVSYVAEVNVD